MSQRFTLIFETNNKKSLLFRLFCSPTLLAIIKTRRQQERRHQSIIIMISVWITFHDYSLKIISVSVFVFDFVIGYLSLGFLCAVLSHRGHVERDCPDEEKKRHNLKQFEDSTIPTVIYLGGLDPRMGKVRLDQNQKI